MFSVWFINVRKRSCGKVMFLHLPVSHSVHRGRMYTHLANTPRQTPPARHPPDWPPDRHPPGRHPVILVSGVGPGFCQGADSEAEKASHLWPGFIVRLRALKVFGFLMLKYISLYRKIKQGPKMLNFGTSKARVKDGRVPGSPGSATVFTSRLS